MWIVVSCGNPDRRRAELDFGSSESFDDFHGPSALGAKPEIARTRCGDLGLGWWCCTEQRKAEWQGGGTSAASKEAEVANAHEAFGKYVQQEAAQELICRKGHELLLAAMSVVLPSEGDSIVVEGDETMVGDGNTVSVASQVVEDMFGPSERSLGIEHPILTEQRSQKSVEGFRFAEGLQASGKQ